jgi:transposase-like protein
MAKRRTFTPEFKAKVVLEMLVEGKSMAQASREYGIKDTMLSRWKQQFIEPKTGVTIRLLNWSGWSAA